MTGPLRWGIVGPGRIADSVTADFPHVEGAVPVAVASRDRGRGEAFAAKHGIERVHDSYRAVIDDPDVDVLYIATPHPMHHAVALAAIDAGKALLVEKSFTATVAGAVEVVDRARSAGVFVMEAMWTRFQPVVVALRELIADGAIGDVRAVQADLGMRRPFDLGSRLFSLELGGGAVLDLGVYPISFAQMVLGDPARVTAGGSAFETGADAEAGILLEFGEGRTATLACSLRGELPGSARVFGTEGWIDVVPQFHHPETIVLHCEGVDPEEITRPRTGGGYAHELIEVTECVRAGRTESAVMPLADTLVVQDVMGQVLDQLGVRHAEAPMP